VVMGARDRDHAGRGSGGERQGTDDGHHRQGHGHPATPAGRIGLGDGKSLEPEQTLVGDAGKPGQLAPVGVDDVGGDALFAGFGSAGRGRQVGGQGQPQVTHLLEETVESSGVRGRVGWGQVGPAPGSVEERAHGALLSPQACLGVFLRHGTNSCTVPSLFSPGRRQVMPH
jgi:hypothetical protein